MISPTVIQVKDLCKAFGATIAVRDFDLEVGKGEVLGLVGPNGAGKTTLLRILSTLLTPTNGRATVFGFDLRRDYLEIRRRVGYLPDFFNLYRDLTLSECLTYFAHAYGTDPDAVAGRVEYALDAAGLKSKRSDMIRHLSRGMVQRLGVAVLLARDADVLLLDEPASGLDPRARNDLRRLLKSLGTAGKTIIVSSHILSDLSETCTHIAVMDLGRIVRYGSVAEVVRQTGDKRCFLFRVQGPVSAAAAALSGVENITGTRLLDDALAVDADDLETVAAANAALVRHGIPVVGIEETSTGLEDVFLQITAPGAERPE